MNIQGEWGFELEGMDKAVRPQDDFFRYANGGWMKRTEIPPDEAKWGSFYILGRETDERLRALFEEKRNAQELTDEERKALAYYQSAMDMERRNALHDAPLLPFREKIASLSSPNEFAAYFAGAARVGLEAEPWGIHIGQDEKDAESNILYFFQGGLGMPEREYYLQDTPENLRVREAYRAHIVRLLVLSGKTEEDARAAMERIVSLETRLAKASMTKEDTRFPEKTYHKMTLAELEGYAPGFSWSVYFNALELPVQGGLIVSQPDFLKEVASLFGTLPLDDWKTYLEFHLINGAVGALSESFVNENFTFYGKTLSGQKELKPLWRRALGATESALRDVVGKMFAERYFKADAKRRMDELADNVVSAYASRIHNLSWMGDETKKRALQKLAAIKRKIGFPDVWRDYGGLAVDDDDYFGNALRAGEHAFQRERRKLNAPVDRGEWFMSASEVNAYYAPTMNDIAFPAAILQPPFFNLSDDSAVNYGAIGAVIGHELTHGFDDQGSKYDSAGNLNEWWTLEDRKRFDEKGNALGAQFNNYRVQGTSVNGEYTKGENIADLGGLVIAYDAFQAHLARHPEERVKKDGFTPEQRFFLGFAQAERAILRDEAVKTQILTDPHSPAEFRVNGPVSNFTPFYEAFDVKEGDALYRPPEERVEIW